MDGYKRLMFTDVPDWQRRLCKETAAKAAWALGLPDLSVRYWRSTTGSMLAWVNPWINDSEINVVINKLTDPRDLEYLIYHEAKHLHQWQDARYLGDPKAGEADANTFAYSKTHHIVENLAESWEYK